MRTDTHRPTLKLLALACGGALAAIAACELPVGNFSGKTCSAQTDCPDPYACIIAQRGALKTCELMKLPAFLDGGAEPLDGGGVFYCAEVKAILDTNCVTCHGPTQQNGDDFRLDWYETDGGVPGAKAYADRIKLRAYDTATMPPPSASHAPTQDQRRTLAVWAVAGAPYCDGGTPGADAGP